MRNLTFQLTKVDKKFITSKSTKKVGNVESVQTINTPQKFINTLNFKDIRRKDVNKIITYVLENAHVKSIKYGHENIDVPGEC